jgi:GNAT superfamily N-acetyltransferase
LIAPRFDAYRRFYKQRSEVAGARKCLRVRLERKESVIFLVVARRRGIPDPTGRDKNVAPTRRTYLQALGFVQLYPSFDSVTMRRVWILYDLFVVPAARKRGVATLLMERA